MSEGDQRLTFTQYDTATGVLNTESVYEHCKDRSDISAAFRIIAIKFLLPAFLCSVKKVCAPVTIPYRILTVPDRHRTAPYKAYSGPTRPTLSHVHPCNSTRCCLINVYTCNCIR